MVDTTACQKRKSFSSVFPFFKPGTQMLSSLVVLHRPGRKMERQSRPPVKVSSMSKLPMIPQGWQVPPLLRQAGSSAL